MLFLEDLYATKRPTLEERRAAVGRKSRSLRRDGGHGPETRSARDISSSSADRHERASSTKRNSIFSRRKSTATNSSGESQKRTSSVPSQGGASRRSSVAEMAVTDGEGLKSKLLFGFHSTKKHGPRKSDPTSQRQIPDPPMPMKRDRSFGSHKRATSTGDHDQASQISAPFGFQHLAKIERSGKSPEGGMTEARVAALSSEPNISRPSLEMQSNLSKRPQKRPPPLRPKRPDDDLIPRALLSPQYNDMPSLRQIRSAETFGHGSPMAHPNPSPGMPSPGFGTFTAPPPRRSSRLPPGFPLDQRNPTSFHAPSRSTDSNISGDWDRILPLYDQQSQPAPPPPNPPIPSIYRPGSAGVSEKQVVQPPMGSPLFSPPLGNILEEPEAPNSPPHSRVTVRQPSIRHAKSSPSMSRNASRSSPAPPAVPKLPAALTITLKRPTSQGSDTLGDLARRSFTIKEEKEEEVKDTCKGICVRETTETVQYLDSWEDDIDFCYQHSAEAACDFDWTNTSRFLDLNSSDEELKSGKRFSNRGSSHKITSSFDSTSGSEGGFGMQRSFFRRKSTAQSKESLPELDHGLSHSVSSNSLTVGTPHEKFGFPVLDGFRNTTIHRNSGESFGLASPRLPPLDLRHDLDSDQLYEDLMAGFNLKQQQSQLTPALPVLEAKTYTSPGPSPALSQKAFERKVIPTSAPATIAASLLKELPPLPPASPPGANSAASPQSGISPLSVNTIVAGLRSPNESPIDRSLPQFQSRQIRPFGPDSSPPRPGLKRKPTRPSPSPTIRIQELIPSSLTRNGSNDTIVTAIAIPLSPPASPQRPPPPPPPFEPPQLPMDGSPLKPEGYAISRSVSAGPSFAPTPSKSSSVFRAPSLSAIRPSIPPPQQMHKKAASSDGVTAPMSTTPPDGSESTTPTSNPRDSRQSYSLFPSAQRPQRPRRLTAT